MNSILKKDKYKLIIFGLLILSILIIPEVVVAQENPKVLFDETGPYGKYYTINNLGPYGASSFANVIESNGFNVYKTNEAPLNYEYLKNYDILVLMAPERNYTDTEIKAIQDFVKNGGGLFLIGDSWGVEDGAEDYAYNKIAQSFGVSYDFNTMVVDSKDYTGYTYYFKVNNVSTNPVTSGINDFYFMLGPHIKNTGASNVIAYSDPESWADKLSLTSEGYSVNNEQKDAGEESGPLPLAATLEYGKGKIVFFGAVTTFSNSFLYRSNGWKLGLNTLNWLSDQPVPSNYKTAGLLSPTAGDFSYKILGLLLVTLILLAGLAYAIMRNKKTDQLKPVKTIKNWKYNSIIGLNALFIILGVILFFVSILIYNLLDNTQIDYYDPFLGYSLVIIGILFTLFSGLNIYNLFHRQRLVSNYSFINIVIILFFASYTFIMSDIFPFPTVSDYTLESLILLIPSVVNLWLVHQYGSDLIIEGKEFNRLTKMSSKSLPYELHSHYTDASYRGEGGFGRVFQAKRKDGQHVAIKIPKTFDKKSETIFVSEVSNWRLLDHPNIVKLFDFKILPIPYIEMEFCDGALTHGQKTLKKAVNVVYEVAKGLKYAHGKNIIHGDVKTSNIMINEGIHKISDWGLSKIKLGESVTLSGATPQYAAPEQISNQFGKADERTDIYQLGTVFYEMVTGTLPFKGEISEVYGSILNTQPILPSKLNPESIEVEKIIMKCLNKNKKDRYGSMNDLLNDLEKYYEHSISDKTVIFKKEDEN